MSHDRKQVYRQYRPFCILLWTHILYFDTSQLLLQSLNFALKQCFTGLICSLLFCLFCCKLELNLLSYLQHPGLKEVLKECLLLFIELRISWWIGVLIVWVHEDTKKWGLRADPIYSYCDTIWCWDVKCYTKNK